MGTNTNAKTAAMIPLLVVGLILDVLGIVMTSLGPIRFVVMGVGVLLMLIALVRMMRLRDEDKPGDPR